MNSNAKINLNMKYPIIFTGSNTYILEYLAGRDDIKLEYSFFHKKSGDASKFVKLCKIYSTPYKIVASNKDILEVFKKIAVVDLGICAGFEILPEEIFERPKQGFINIHPSYLPYYKGANPFYHMLMNNEQEGGVSIHKVTKDIDGGKIFCRAKFPILFEDDVSVLIEKANGISVQLLERYLIKILEGKVKGIKNTGGSYYPPVKKRQYIDLIMSPLQIYNLVRSQTIYGGSLLKLNGKTVSVDRAILKSNQGIMKNEIISIGQFEMVLNLTAGYCVTLKIKDYE